MSAPQSNDQQDFTARIEAHMKAGHEFRVARDMALADQIPEMQRCRRCEGTGNQLYFMYQACEACHATGRRTLPYAWAGIPLTALTETP